MEKFFKPHDSQGEVLVARDLNPHEKDTVRGVVKQYDSLLDQPGTRLDVESEALTTHYKLTNRDSGVRMVLSVQKHGIVPPLTLKEEPPAAAE